MSYTLYSYFRSSASFRVRAALRLKGIAYRYEPVHLLEGGGQHLQAAYRALNPMAELPTLVVHADDGSAIAALAQSVAILEYLEEVHPEPALLPRDALGRARVRQIVECVNSSIQPYQNLKLLRKLVADYGNDQAKNDAWARHFVSRGFDGLELLVASVAGRHAFGDSPTLADVALVPQVFNARRFGVDMDAYPTIARVTEAAMALEAFRGAHPDAQPDAPTSK
ncbi:MAG: maleylacetoacetate isomerase [Myxococcota bacterium]